MADISNSENIIDVRDITQRVEELREERKDHDEESGAERGRDGRLIGESLDDDGEPVATVWEGENPDDAQELKTLEELLSNLRGYGGDHQWEGNWYPVTLIADGHFTDYAENLVTEIGDLNSKASYIVIDWEATAKNVRQDYASVDYDGAIYWYR